MQHSYPCGSLEGQAGLGGWDKDAPYFNRKGAGALLHVYSPSEKMMYLCLIDLFNSYDIYMVNFSLHSIHYIGYTAFDSQREVD